MSIKVGERAQVMGIRGFVPILLAVLIVVVLLLGLATPALGAEDSQVRIKNLKVSVWPEYDEPRVLVMYQGEFADKASFPKIVKFRLPKDAEIGQVCALSEKQEHLCQLYETKKGEDFVEITYTLPIPTFFIEYYYNPVQDGARNIPFTYSNVYAADKMDVEVQQPLRAADFSVTPNALSVSTDNKGFKYHQLSFDNVNAEQKLDLSIAYSKEDKNPSVPKAKQGGGTTGSAPDVNLWLLVGGAAGLAGVVYVGMTRRNNRRYAPQPARGQSRAASGVDHSRQTVSGARSGAPRGNTPAQAPQGHHQGARFCSGCGTPLEPDDRFCSTCGKKSK